MGKYMLFFLFILFSNFGFTQTDFNYSNFFTQTNVAKPILPFKLYTFKGNISVSNYNSFENDYQYIKNYEPQKVYIIQDNSEKFYKSCFGYYQIATNQTKTILPITNNSIGNNLIYNGIYANGNTIWRLNGSNFWSFYIDTINYTGSINNVTKEGNIYNFYGIKVFNYRSCYKLDSAYVNLTYNSITDSIYNVSTRNKVKDRFIGKFILSDSSIITLTSNVNNYLFHFKKEKNNIILLEKDTMSTSILGNSNITFFETVLFYNDVIHITTPNFPKAIYSITKDGDFTKYSFYTNPSYYDAILSSISLNKQKTILHEPRENYSSSKLYFPNGSKKEINGKILKNKSYVNINTINNIKYYLLYDSLGVLKKKIPVHSIVKNDLFNQYFNSFTTDCDANVFIAAHDTSSNKSYLYRIDVDNDTNNINIISGIVKIDTNSNCLQDSFEIHLENNWMVELKNGNTSTYAFTDIYGYYHFEPSDTGKYEIILHNKDKLLWPKICDSIKQVHITNQNPLSLDNDFSVQPSPCYFNVKLKVKVVLVGPLLINGMQFNWKNTYKISVQNLTKGFENYTYVDINFDDFNLQSLEWANVDSARLISANTYRFYTGRINPFETKYFTIKGKLKSNRFITGQTICLKAQVFPRKICKNLNVANITVNGICTNTDSIIFIIKNEGAITSSANKKYFILKNDSIAKEGIYQLFPNQILRIGLKNEEAFTYRLITYQDANYNSELSDSIVTAVVEGCTQVANRITTGFVDNIVYTNAPADVDIECNQIVGSFDPNDKKSSPIGFSNEHLIEKNTSITYTIRFQNTGTYYAFYVKLLDSISTQLDINTFKVIESSHKNIATIENNILKVEFFDILLPWLKFDSINSNGYFRYQIKPKQNVIDGDVIKNYADIYFDENSPVRTDTTFHTIGTNFITIKIVSSNQNNLSKIKTTIYPNPFTQTATLSFDYNQPTQLTIFSMDGKIMQQYQSTDNFYTIDRKQLSNGMYLYELKKIFNNELLDKGKLVIQ